LRSIGTSASGGIEKAIEELATRFVAAGHQVTVFCRKRYVQDVGSTFKGVQLKALPAIYTKHLEAISNTVVAVFSALRGYDVIHINATGPALLSFIPRLLGRKVVVTVHGLDWKREKWGALAKIALRLGSRAAVTFPNRTVVVSRTLQDYYTTDFNRSTTYIPNGVTLPGQQATSVLSRFGLVPDEYILFLSRLVPEKGCHTLIQAFRALDTRKKLVIVGAHSHSEEYADSLRRLAEGDDRIVFTGPLYDDDKNSIYRGAYFFVLPSTIEGMALVLLEAMSFGKCCLCSDIDENLEVISPRSSSYTTEDPYGFRFATENVSDLTQRMASLISDPAAVQRVGQRAYHRVATEFDWGHIAEQYLSVFRMAAPTDQ
jgi:glycosyltransferase involved in cell wall biosynthesis